MCLPTNDHRQLIKDCQYIQFKSWINDNCEWKWPPLQFFWSHGQSFISGLCANNVLSKLNLLRFKLKFKITLSEANSSLICLIGSRATASNLATTNWPLNSLKNDQLMQLIWWAINEMLWWRQWMWNRLLHVNGFGFHCEKVGQTCGSYLCYKPEHFDNLLSYSYNKREGRLRSLSNNTIWLVPGDHLASIINHH